MTTRIRASRRRSSHQVRDSLAHDFAACVARGRAFLTVQLGFAAVLKRERCGQCGVAVAVLRCSACALALCVACERLVHAQPPSVVKCEVEEAKGEDDALLHQAHVSACNCTVCCHAGQKMYEKV